jgi:hypothetical protein
VCALFVAGCGVASGNSTDGFDAPDAAVPTFNDPSAGGSIGGRDEGETCGNGADDDGDGLVDEFCPCTPGTTQRCFFGAASARGVGACVEGTQRCESKGEFAQWGPCEGAVSPRTETCDGRLDEDCDGAVDEGCSCIEGESRDCGSDVGVCQKGRQTCVNGQWSECIGNVPPREEACDGERDDNCDGQIDEGCECTNGAKQSCGIGIGACALGERLCENGRWGACVGAGEPQPETCDGRIDENCDGVVDEGCGCYTGETRACGSSVGACRQGVQRCVAGAWAACEGDVRPRTEVCDGRVDDNCDGQIDEGCTCTNGTRRACGIGVGACVLGEQECSNGAWGPCVGDVRPEPAERCDGRVDDDCDGQVDNGCECTDGSERDCGSGVGACVFGKQRCENGRWSECAGAGVPTAERCDGDVDENCDGVVDEGCDCVDGSQRACGSSVGACRQGTQTCEGGQWGACENAVGPKEEVCDGQADDNCNGVVDEGCDCVNGREEPCGIGIGACVLGVRRCERGKWSACIGDVKPTEEICDGRVDDNCDGRVDDGCECTNGDERTCGIGRGVCTLGKQTCVAGRWAACVGAGQPRTETCDGVLDENCDGQVDEGCDCTNGVRRACGIGIGACTLGSQECTFGRWGDCTGDVRPKAEVCEGSVDDDCDGVVDNGCDCTNGTKVACGIGRGACTLGERTCVDGRFGECVGDVKPKPEVCDGTVDDDCNGVVDDGCECTNGTKIPCGITRGACRQGERTCVNGRYGECVGEVRPRTEVCDGHVDDDCDGVVDNGCDCTNGATRSCGRGVGRCVLGLQTCQAGRWGACVGEGQPTAEVCDGAIDDDCDGVIDNGCQCVNGRTQACGVSAVGACRLGTQTCANGLWGQCVGAVLPTPTEICDGTIDHNCNGRTDAQDGCVCNNGETRACPGKLGECAKNPGSQTCVNGQWGTCQGGTQPVAEICDGVRDDNCDGLTDAQNGCVCNNGQTRPCPGKLGECAKNPGTQTCANGQWGVCQGGTQPVAEICDGVRDDNCDGLTDTQNGCQCFLGQTQACAGSNVGICRAGARSCENGRWSTTCFGAVYPQAEVCGNAVDEDCNGVAEPCVSTVTLAGDCQRAACPANTPHPVGCSVRMSGDDSRGCVAWAPGDTSVYFKEGNRCNAGTLTVTLSCSSVPGAINAQTCPILNKSDRRYVSREQDCPR